MNLTDNLFVGKLIRFAAPHPDDAAIMAKWMDTPDYWHLLSSDPARPQTADDLAAADKHRKDDGNQFEFRLRTLEGDKLIGFFALHVTWSNQVANLAIGIGEQANWGRGYGSDALRLGVDYAFRELGVYKVALSVFSDNTRAIRSYEKTGFTHEAVRRAMGYRDGQRLDWVEMGILRPEWEARRNS